MRILLGLALSFFASSAFGAAVDLQTSSFTYFASKITGATHTGGVKLKSAQFDEAKGTGTFVIDMNTITNTDIKGEWHAKFLSHITSGDFFQVKKYPTAKLVIESMKNGQLTGKMTIKDKTNPVKLSYAKNGKSFSGELAFNRTKYGIIYNSKNFFKNLGDKVISDEVKIKFNVVTK